MQALPLFDTKLPGEKRVLTFDFTADLPSGVTLSGTPTVTVAVLDGTDSNPSAILNGAAQVDSTGLKVLQAVQGGLDLTDYLITAQCSSTVSTFAPGWAGVLPVRAKPSQVWAL